MEYLNPLSWFSSDIIRHRLWISALLLGLACESVLYYETLSCAQPTAGLGGIFCYVLLFPALPILLIVGEIILRALSITTITSLPGPILVVLEAFVFILNVVCIALIVFGVLRVASFMIKKLLSSH